MRKTMFLAAAAAAMLAAADGARADTIAAGDTAAATVFGTTSIYQIFGHNGAPGGGGAATDAILFEFAAASGNVFTFDATGLVDCCGGVNLNIPPDGGNSGMNVGGANGLSSLSGNANIPLVGVFTTDADPFGGVAPAALSFDVANPSSLSPLLHQVFYIGDGHAGEDDPLGAQLTFTAPTNATRLYIGVIDAFSFSSTTGYYADNDGSFAVSVSLANDAGNGGAVPEPAAWALMILGFGAAGASLRAQRRRQDPGEGVHAAAGLS
ncbi:PEPxxWA-CTERM sorting domain-containing protein [Phenylobacterium sp.]|uniref:PEPxxWA-CTERM sorting domain-containing protein n=1 Tax=Phenylobacterium sp. TaxID=1871053 RepID=UPI0025FD92F2|nr:PEPxxWA-CTERM sorting domain-containing protein [Phenylobacterium sp.]